MTESGFTVEGWSVCTTAWPGHVEAGKLPGLVTLVARHDRTRPVDDVHVDVIGTKAIGDAEPMPRDAIFRIASLTKPIAAAAAMILVDDGVLALDAAVDAYLPELADRRVLRSLDAPTRRHRAGRRGRSRSTIC